MGSPLNLFEHALVQTLTQRFGPQIRIILTDNRRSVISIRKTSEVIHVRLARIFAWGETETWEALVRYIKGDIPRVPSHVMSYIEQSPISPKIRRKTLSRIRPNGNVYNLNKIVQKLNHEYFDGSMKVPVTWGGNHHSQFRRKRKRSIQLGSYDYDLGLIRIHPILDNEAVPVKVVEWIVYHEMLHKKLCVTWCADGRRRLHTPEFRKQERQFTYYEEAIDWERKHLNKLLHSYLKPRASAATKKAIKIAGTVKL